MPLTSKQRSFLRSQAHHLKSVYQVGKEGITDASVQALMEVLSTHELVKVKVQESAPLSARDAGAALVERVAGAEQVQTIGRTVVIYRRHPESPEIKLPK